MGSKPCGLIGAGGPDFAEVTSTFEQLGTTAGSGIGPSRSIATTARRKRRAADAIATEGETTVKQTNFLRPMVLGAVSAMALVGAGAAYAEEEAKAPAAWEDTLVFSGQIEFGGTFNSASPKDKKNFGRLFDDTANSLVLNHVALTAARPIDPAAEGYDFGFKVQAMYGSDSRYTHFLHDPFSSTNNINQLDVVEANLQFHTPWLGEGGMDIKVGQYPTLLGYEVIDPSGNPLYSHSYIFNFGIPLKHTGFLTTTHVNATLDIYAGIDTGVNTSIGRGDNNTSLAFQGGIGLNNLADGKLTIIAATHIGPENATAAIPNGLLPRSVKINSAYRYLTDVLATYKYDDNWTFITELNWIHDDALNGGSKADGYGIAQYVTYAFSDTTTFIGRAEIWDDRDGIFVAQSGNNVDFVRFQEGKPSLSARSVGGGQTTYGALTAGVNYKPAVDSPLTGLTFRPEVRFDTSLNNTKPFNDSKDQSSFTFGIDAIIAF